MPTITPAPRHARDATPNSGSESRGTGFCLPCYADGQTVLAAVQPDGAVCAVHARAAALSGAENDAAAGGPLSAAAAAIGSCGADGAPTGRAGRGPRGRQARTERRAAARTRTRTQAREAAVRRVRAQHTGRARAAARLQRGTFAPHPGWRNFIPPGWRVLTSQQEALQVLQVLVETQRWRCDRATSWSQILRALVDHMDWDTGLVTALTAARLGAAGERGERTVSRVIAWAQDAGLLFVVESGATAAFLGGDRNRTPTYALITNAPHPDLSTALDPHPDTDPGCPEASKKLLVADPLEQLGDLPNSHVEITTRTRRLKPAAPANTSWPVLQVPQTATERSSAGRRLLTELGLDGGKASSPARKINFSRWWAMLKPWWDSGWSPRGLAWAIEHHPDRPNHHRGDIRAGATDLVAVIGARLAPWRGRHHELPAHLVGIRGDYRTSQAAHIAARIDTAAVNRAAEQNQVFVPVSSSASRARARAYYRANRTDRGQRHCP